MVPLLLLFWLLVEIASYLAAAHHWLGLAWPQAGLAAAGLLLAMRAGINATTWIFSIAYGSPVQSIGPLAWLRMVLAEYLAFLATFVLIIPFERLWMGRDRLRPEQQAIVLVHGYGCSRGAWWWLRRQLEKAGHSVATVSLVPPYTNIGKMVPLLHQRIDEVCRESGCDQVILVGHSMGGLVARSYLSRHGIGQVAKLITLATPHSGSELARIAMLGANAREMEPHSHWLNDMNRERVSIPAVAIRTPHDNYVMPQDNQRLAGATDVPLPGLGHLAMLYSRRTLAALLAALPEVNGR